MFVECRNCGNIYSTRRQWNRCPHLNITKSIVRLIKRYTSMARWAIRHRDADFFHTLRRAIHWWRNELGQRLNR